MVPTILKISPPIFKVEIEKAKYRKILPIQKVEKVPSKVGDSLGGPVVKNLTLCKGHRCDPGLGRSHAYGATKPMPTSTEAHVLEPMYQRRSRCSEQPTHQLESSPYCCNQRNMAHSNKSPAQPKMNKHFLKS